MFTRRLGVERKPRKPRRAVLEMLETRQMPAAAGLGQLLHRHPAHVAKVEPLDVRQPSTPASSDATTLDVALTLVPVSGKGLRLSVPVTVAGVSRTYLLDTGSSGMYVARYGISRSAYKPTQNWFHQKYSSGIHYTGKVIKTDVSFPGGPTASRVRVGLINRATGIPNWGKSLRNGNPPYENAFYGTLGMSLVPGSSRQGDLYSIVAQLPGNLSSGFIVHASATGGPPQLTIGLTPDNMRGFSTLPMPAANGTPQVTPYLKGNGAANRVPAWNDKGVGVGYLIGGMQLFSSATVFDTGEASTVLYTGNVPGSMLSGGALSNDLPFRAGLAPGVTWNFSTGEKVNVDRVYVSSQDRGTVNTGIGVFFRYDVMYDIADGTIGFRPAATVNTG